MFSTHISEDDLFNSMENGLLKIAADEATKEDNIKKEIVELLNIAAENCDNEGLVKHAELITKVAEHVVRSPSSEKQIQNLIHHGTPLDLPAKIKMKAPAGRRDYNKDEDTLIIVDDDKELGKDDLEELKFLF
jgi:hypothetical protein